MKVILLASARNRHHHSTYYKLIIENINEFGYELIGGNVLSVDLEKIKNETAEERKQWYDSHIKNLTNSDMVVAEITQPTSVNVGHMLTMAKEMRKPTLALYRKEGDPYMLRTIDFPWFKVIEYNSQDLSNHIQYWLEVLADYVNKRFTLIMPGTHVRFLDSVKESEGISRSDFIRGLIADEMKRREK